MLLVSPIFLGLYISFTGNCVLISVTSGTFTSQETTGCSYRDGPQSLPRNLYEWFAFSHEYNQLTGALNKWRPPYDRERSARTHYQWASPDHHERIPISESTMSGNSGPVIPQQTPVACLVVVISLPPYGTHLPRVYREQ